MTRRRGLLWIVGFVFVTLVALAALGWLVRFSEPQLAFFPTKGEDATPASFGIAFTPITVPTADGEQLRVWHLPHASPRAQVVYFHGNGGNLSLWSDVLVDLARHRFDVIGFDYRGYGLSTGAPSEGGLYRDTDAVLELAATRLRRADVPLIYWGRSLGTTVAAYASTRRAPDGVILEAGFPSMRAVVRSNPILSLLSWFSTYEFPTARWMTLSRVPALLLHGDADSIIPYELGRELHDAIPGPKQFVAIPGGDHNDPTPRDAAAYWGAVDAFVQRAGGKTDPSK
jgi:pimeloyl-ACP methyl ester carboxylesterase